ncbi:hypothetical protein NOR_06475 [Metarhizium rileyi]|uniref:Uncharacterized protein n=1 Tax=Metarhizium rileyi (strain RCEF 4871) TaxID=1649241 RepID=A0A167AE90_METRR|nr:hypothetical protein NOR_06475 [Metarhizium rileyi RCEF 4871]
MDDVVVEAEQRQQLREVADHMLDIYRTLARMKYIEYDWIVQGPYGISNLVSIYRGFGLHDPVIYLYSILPYIDNGSLEGVDFYGGGETADFRREEDVEQGRNPTRDHCIWVLTQDAVGSVDPILNDLALCQLGLDKQLGSSSDAHVSSDKWGDPDDEDEKCAYERMYHRPACATSTSYI